MKGSRAIDLLVLEPGKYRPSTDRAPHRPMSFRIHLPQMRVSDAIGPLSRPPETYKIATGRLPPPMASVRPFPMEAKLKDLTDRGACWTVRPGLILTAGKVHHRPYPRLHLREQPTSAPIRRPISVTESSPERTVICDSLGVPGKSRMRLRIVLVTPRAVPEGDR
jgi:hypothetical protein